MFYSLLSSLEEKKQNEGECCHVIFPPKIPSGDKEWHKDLILSCRDEHLFHLTPTVSSLCGDDFKKSVFLQPDFSVITYPVQWGTFNEMRIK